MSETSVGFIGGGRIATIFLGGWSQAGVMPAKIVVCDTNPEVVAKLKNQYPSIEVASPATAAGQDLVFLAVHPPVIAGMLPPLAPLLKPDATIISLAPKFTVAKLTALLGGFARIARMIPNAPSIVGRGYNPTVFGSALTASDRAALRTQLTAFGECVEVPEAQLETYAVVTAMGLTFLWPQLYMLLGLAETAGVPRDAAFRGIERMLAGAVAAMRDADMKAEQVQDLVPVKPVADDVAAFVAAARPKLEGLLAKLKP